MAPRLPSDDGPHSLRRPLALLTSSFRAPLRVWRRLPRPVAWSLGASLALAGYALLGSQLLPWLLRRQAIAQVRERYHRELQITAVEFDPFACALELVELALPDADGRTLVGFQRIYVNFEPLASVWQRALVFSDIRLGEPRVRAIVRRDGTLNFQDLESQEPTPPEAQQQELPRLAIEHLSVTDGDVMFADDSRAEPFSQRFTPITFGLNGFRTTAAGGEFSLSAQSAPAQRFWWKGSIALSPALSSTGRFALKHVPVMTVADYLGDAVPFVVSSGELAVSGSYQVQLGANLAANVQLAGVKVDGLAVHARDALGDRVAIEAIALNDVRADLREQELDVAHVALRGVRTNAVLGRDGKLNLARLAGAPRASTSDTPSAPWKLRIGGLSVQGALSFEDRGIEPPMRLGISSLELAAQTLTLDTSKAIPFALQLQLDDHCRVKVWGDATPSPPAANVEVQLEDARVARAQPYVQPFADLTIHEGLLAFRGKFVLAPPHEGHATMSAAGDLTLRGLRTTDNAQHQPFVDIGELKVEQLRYRSAPESIEIARVELHKPYARVLLSANQELNVTSIMHGKGSGVVAAPDPTPNAMSSEHPLAKADLTGTQVHVGQVAVDGMRLSFTDHFIKPNFSAELHELRGTLSELSTDADAFANVALAGRLGASSPVSIAGRLKPFAYEQASDIRLSWSNVPLPVFNPYSDRFAGYSIVRGDLATQLHYKLVRGKLDAQHHVRVDQLEWGEATETKQKADLPVRLATAMLRDRHGVITLDLPVQGKLDDPSFHVGPILWQVVKNVAVKAATAPFEWLGSLFEGAEKARFVEFAPGEVTLGASDAKELATLAQALEERPNLRVDVPLGVDPTLDRRALVERKYQRELRNTIGDELWGARKNSAYSALDAGDRIDVLEALFKRLKGVSPKLPDAPAAPKESSWSERRAAKKAFQVSTLEQMTRAAVEVDQGELEELGLKRANAIEKALTANGKVDSTRVLVTNAGKVSSDQGRVRFELSIE